MNEKDFELGLNNVLQDRYGREFVRTILRECGIDLVSGISFDDGKHAHTLGLDLLHKIMYNNIEELKKLISEQKTLEVKNGRGSGDYDS